jgi:hypothetical protein
MAKRQHLSAKIRKDATKTLTSKKPHLLQFQNKNAINLQ